jgi:hypothetical protein
MAVLGLKLREGYVDRWEKGKVWKIRRSLRPLTATEKQNMNEKQNKKWRTGL